MSYFANPVEEDRCVFLTYEGQLPGSERCTARHQTHEWLKTKGWARVVLDITQLGPVITPTLFFNLAYGLRRHTPPLARMALVVREDQIRYANLIEKLAQKDGVFLASFMDPDKAVLWVKETGEPCRHKINHRAQPGEQENL